MHTDFRCKKEDCHGNPPDDREVASLLVKTDLLFLIVSSTLKVALYRSSVDVVSLWILSPEGK